ncbi:MAG: hypothetical protein JO155_01230 [Acidimicrobiia bacterium]|nr:hypothetical protein [Acidimicrobiia bacterium]
MPRLRVPQPPQDPRVRRVILVVVGFIALAAVALSFKGSSTPTADDEIVPTTTTVAANITTTTLDPKAIQAGVAGLLSHEGATPQQLSAVPANTSSHHTRAGGHSKK